MHGGHVVKPGLAGRSLDLGYRGELVVEGADLSVPAGEVTALIGANGSGKSTLLRALARLHRADAGDIVLDGETAAADLSARAFARRVTLLAQSRPSPGGITVRDVVGFGRHPHRSGWAGRDAEGAAAVAWALEVTNLEAMADRGVDELSGGERQRAWLASCLAQKTSVLLLDEPTTYLDLRYQVEILDLVRDLADVHGVAIGVVLHDLQQAADVADRIVLLDGGRVRAAGRPADVMTTEHLSRAFGLHIQVDHDATGGLRVRPVGRHHQRVPVAG